MVRGDFFFLFLRFFLLSLEPLGVVTGLFSDSVFLCFLGCRCSSSSMFSETARFFEVLDCRVSVLAPIVLGPGVDWRAGMGEGKGGRGEGRPSG